LQTNSLTTFYRTTANAYAWSSYRNLSVKRVHCDKTKEPSAHILYHTKERSS